jgi:hypothetical protein
MRKLVTSLLTTLLLSFALLPTLEGSAAAPQPVVQYAETITANGAHKLPSGAVANGQLHVTWSFPKAANYATRGETARGFNVASPPLGSVGDNSTYFNNALAIDKNNVVHAVWIEGGGVVRHRSQSNGVWSATHTVASGTNFANNGTLVAASTGRLFAAWRYQGSNPDGNIGFVTSDNAGVSWSGVVDVSLPAGTYAGLPRLAAGPSGQVFLTWTGVDGNVYVGEYNGSTFVPTRITSGSNFFNSSVSVAPNGQPYAAWRSADNGAYFGFRSNGQWTIQKVFGHSGMTGPVAIVVDAQSNVHLAWISQQAGSGQFQAWYSLKTPSENWTVPLVVSNDGAAFKSNINMVVGLNNGAALAHIFWESYADGQYIRYAQVKTPIAPPLSGSLQINGGATLTRQPTVSVTINNTSSTPATSYSLADGVDPGTPNQAFSNPTTVNFNLNVADGLCRTHIVYGKIAGSSSVSSAFSGSIIYDPSAQAYVQARNPHWPFNQTLNAFGNALVPGGDVAYTREQRFNLSVAPDGGECSGLRRYAIKRPGIAPAADDWKAVPAEGYISANISFIADQGQGEYRFDVHVEDGAGNVTTTPYSTPIVYDATPPSVSGADSLTAAPTSAKGGVAQITIPALTVSDNLYTGAPQSYWGYWVLVKRSDAGAPSAEEWDRDGMITSGPLSSTLRWNMARGMVGGYKAFAPGQYTVYLRLLDGAGNGSAALATNAVQVNQLEFPSYLPMTRR